MNIILLENVILNSLLRAVMTYHVIHEQQVVIWLLIQKPDFPVYITLYYFQQEEKEKRRLEVWSGENL